MKTSRLSILLFLIFFIGGIYFKRIKNPPVYQPIKYSHKLHIENGLECADCHANAYKGEKATLPSIETCLECHEESLTGSPEEEKIRLYAREKGEIPWRRILYLGDHVYFSHFRHVTLGKIDCINCHGDMAKMEVPPEKPLKKMGMGECIRCHKERKITDDCNACHR